MSNVSRREFLRRTQTAAVGVGMSGILWQQAMANATAKTPTDSWTLFRGDEYATGVTSSCLPDEPKMLWKYEVKNGAFEATPVIKDGICYVPDLDGVLHAIQLSDGKSKWTKKTNAFAFAASPALKDDRIFVGDIDGLFYCYNLAGEEQWKFETQAEINSSACFYDGKVLFGSQDATLYCVDQNNGKLAWKIEVQDQIRCSPTVVQDRSFVAGCDGHLHIIDLKEGKETAAVEIGSPTGATPAVMGDHVFFGTYGGDIFKIDWKQAKVKWRFTDERRREIRSSVALSEKMLVIGSRGKIVYGIDPESGKEKWRFDKAKRGIDSSPLICCDRVFVAATDGRAYLLDLMSGEEVWKKETGGGFTGSPAVVDNKLIIASDDGVVYCFG